MTFLQPWILWGLPLILLPVVIHLLNRLRHRPQPWGAMSFLLAAARQSTRRAKLTQFLILLLRVLAVLFLVIWFGRPLASGWMGWMVASAPDVILLLLDRSASMETRRADGGETFREQAIQAFAQAAAPYAGASRLVVIDSATRRPQEIANATYLTNLTAWTPTDTAADIPAMVQTALYWMLDNRAGATELWLASDLQQSNWRPEDSRWQSLVDQLRALPQRVRVRLLAFNTNAAPNAAVGLEDLVRRDQKDHSELQLGVRLERSRSDAERIPLTLGLNGGETSLDLEADAPSVMWRHVVKLGGDSPSGWGLVRLPADANLRDNTAYFVYGNEPPPSAVVIATETNSIRPLLFAASRRERGGLVAALTGDAGDLTKSLVPTPALVVWQSAIPTGAAARDLTDYVRDGGVVLFLPPGAESSGSFASVEWGPVQSVDAEHAWRVERWDQETGPLSRTDEGANLPLGELAVLKRQELRGGHRTVASFAGGLPFLASQSLGKGEVFFCTTLPAAEWSNLADGTVLVPLVQRLMLTGARRLRSGSFIDCGEPLPGSPNDWVPVDGPAPRDARTQSGVYRHGEREWVVRRPASEDSPERLTLADAQRQFGSIPVVGASGNAAANDTFQGEVWRYVLLAMLLCLLAEACLILPRGEGRQP